MILKHYYCYNEDAMDTELRLIVTNYTKRKCRK